MAGRTRKLTQKTFARKLVIVKFGDNAFDVAAAEKQQDQEEAGRNHNDVFHDNPDKHEEYGRTKATTVRTATTTMMMRPSLMPKMAKANCQPNHNAKTGPPRVYF